jgi:TetR/AcrR family transcriptional repressor of nem operon
LEGEARRQADTSTQILDIAERLVQMRGFNGFSYADVAAELGVTKASLHYHYRSKAELGEALVTRYSRRFGASLQEIEARHSNASDRLAEYARLYADVLRSHRMCLCGMLAADYETLTEPIRGKVLHFFDENEAWLERVLESGRDEGTLEFVGPARETAQVIMSGLEGAMLVARSYGEIERFEAAAARLLGSLRSTSA